VINRNEQAKAVKMDRFKECTNGYTSVLDVLYGRILTISSELNIPARTAGIYELKK
ncbi:MAG: hypothetical protein CVU43_24340, partial [Chloroflexi bacterium HGW-Chloroflexi-5]